MSRSWPALGLLLLLGTAAAVRVHGVDSALVAFDEPRQLQNAIGTRALYYGWVKSTLNPRRQVAEQARERLQQVDPPIFQGLVAIAYVFAGDESLAVPRVIGSLFWLVGGLLLYALARSLFSAGTALIAPAYFLLLPHTVVFSQAFQPDPLMIMLMIASWLAILRNDFVPSFGSAALAGLIAGLAILVEPICAPSIVVLYTLLALRGLGVVGLVLSVESWVMAVLTLGPSAFYYLPDIVRSGRLPTFLASRFQPELWQTPEFWLSWRDMLFDLVHGPYVAAIAALGILLAPSSRARAALVSLALGYLVYGLAFSSHIVARGSYHVQVLPIVGLALASFVRRLWLLSPRVLRPIVAWSLVAGTLALAYWDAKEIQASAWPRTHALILGEPHYNEIGEAVGHSPKVIFLDPNGDGRPLEYYSQVAGWRWPSVDDHPPLEWRAELEQLIDERGAQYFVSTPAEELPKQRELAQFLAERYPQISKSSQYLVYDLRPRL